MRFTRYEAVTVFLYPTAAAVTCLAQLACSSSYRPIKRTLKLYRRLPSSDSYRITLHYKEKEANLDVI